LRKRTIDPQPTLELHRRSKTIVITGASEVAMGRRVDDRDGMRSEIELERLMTDNDT
jgi:hypothetical protein